MPLVSFAQKNFAQFPSIFARILKFKHFRGDKAYAERNFFGEISKKFIFQKIHWSCTASHKPFLYRKRPSQQNGERRKRNEKEDYIYVGCNQLLGHLHPSPPPRCNNGGSCSRLISGPPHPHTPHGRILTVSGDLGQNRGRPPFKSLKVLQLNLDSNCDYVRIFGAVTGHSEAEIDF